MKTSSPPTGSLFLKLLRIAAVLLAVLLVLAILTAGALIYRGHQQWEATKQELAAKGEELRLEELLAPPVPDEQNFFADPLWAEIVETTAMGEDGRVIYIPTVPVAEQRLNVLGKALPWKEAKRLREAYPLLKDVDFGQEPRGALMTAWHKAGEHDEAWRNELAKVTLELLEPATPVLERIDELLKRPGTRFPAAYEEGFTARMPQDGAMMKLEQVFGLRARAEIQTGQTEAALADIFRVEELGRRLENEPFVLARLVMFVGYTLELEAVDAGIRQHAWSDAQLALLQAKWQKMDLLPMMLQAVRGERAGFNIFVDRLAGGKDVRGIQAGIDGGQSQGKTTMMRAYIFVFGGGDRSLRNREEQKLIDTITTNGWKGVRAAPYNEALENPSMVFRCTHFLTFLTGVPWEPTFNRAAFYQDSFVQAEIACALERYYLAYHEYPAALDALAPKYLATAPTEVLTGLPMRYERTAPNQFKLWAAGWNGKDEGGAVSPKKKLGEADWVWGASF